jgi:hypothetical protein
MAQKLMSRSKRQLQEQGTVHAVNAVKMISILTLRNQGWGEQRIRRFSDSFNEILADVSHGHLSLSDIADCIFDETGIPLTDLRVE